MAKYGMAIDLHKCAGCGACGVACKTQNNTDDPRDGQNFNWADYCSSVEGKFPKVSYTMRPTLCNHCSDAPCVAACPVTPKAMYKKDNGITMHNEARCIGCGMCQNACPYSSANLDTDKAAQFSVISINRGQVQPRYNDGTEIIKGCTTSGKEIAAKAGDTPPYRTMHSHPDYNSVRGTGKAEKCIFCEHLVTKGSQPYCVQACPSSARIFGDLSDANSEISKAVKAYETHALADNKGKVQKASEGTKPNVIYLRKYSAK